MRRRGIVFVAVVGRPGVFDSTPHPAQRHLLRNGFPDHLGDLEDELWRRAISLCAHLTGPHTDGVIEPLVLLGVAQVGGSYQPLTVPYWVGAAVAMVL